MAAAPSAGTRSRLLADRPEGARPALRDAAAETEAAAAAAVPQTQHPTVAAPRDGDALLQANLEAVRDAERQLRQALEQDPESEALQRLLISLEGRRRQLDLLLMRAR